MTDDYYNRPKVRAEYDTPHGRWSMSGPLMQPWAHIRMRKQGA